MFSGLLRRQLFLQFVCYPTHKDNTLDIFATTHPSLVTSCNSISGIGDHDGVQVCPDVNINYDRPARCAISMTLLVVLALLFFLVTYSNVQ